MEKINDGYVKVSKENGLATISFYHPSHNSLPSHLLSKLAATIDQLSSDEQTDLILLKSDGDRTFCAGASFDELVAIQNFDQGKTFFMGFANVINAIRRCSKIVIGRVQGKAVGGGVGLASACDYCFATKYASVRLSELAVGIGPFVIGPAVERKVGVSGFSQMALTPNTWYKPDWCLQKGLYMHVSESAEQMDKAIHKLCTELQSMNPVAVNGIKEVVWKGTDHWNTLLEERAEMSGRLILSDFAKNAISGFLKN